MTQHWWIQTWVTDQRHSIQVKDSNVLSCVTLKFNRWPWKSIRHIFYATSFFVHHFIAINQFKLELQSKNAQCWSKLALFLSPVALKFDWWPWKKNKSTSGMCNTPWLALISIQQQHWIPFLELKWWPYVLEGQGQWLPFSIPAKSIPRCKVSRGQAKFPRILSQNGKNDLKGQGQWPPFSIPVKSIPGWNVWCKLGDSSPNLSGVIAQTSLIS